MNNPFDFRVALVTGPHQGMGQATARALAEAGLSHENQEETMNGGDSDERSKLQ